MGASNCGAAERLFELIPNTIELGEVIPGSSIETEFVVKNVSGKPLAITELVPSCTCTTIGSVLPLSIPANAEKVIKIKIVAPDGLGEMKASVAIGASSSNEQLDVVHINYSLQPVVRVMPSRLIIWDTSKENLPISSGFKVESTVQGAPLESVQAESPVDWIEVSVGEIVDNFCSVSLKLKSALPVGQIEIPIAVRAKVAGFKGEYLRNLYFATSVSGSVKATPNIIVFSNDEMKECILNFEKAEKGQIDECSVIPKKFSSCIDVSKVSDDSWQIRLQSRLTEDVVCSLVFSDAKGRPVISVPCYIPLKKTR